VSLVLDNLKNRYLKIANKQIGWSGLKFCLYIFLVFWNGAGVLAQKNYSIDFGTLTNRRVPISYFIEQTQQNIKVSAQVRKEHRLENRESRRIRKHTYAIQTKEVKKRMKESRKKADFYNRGKKPLRVKLKKVLGNG
jgi:hypothetical protein